MKTYKSHKIVKAALLHSITFDDVKRATAFYDGAEHELLSQGLIHRLPADQYVPNSFYIVFYPDGYISFCPRAEFEDGYTESFVAAHPDDEAIDNFADAMKARMAEQRLKQNQHFHWSATTCYMGTELRQALIRNVEDGNMVDVANLAMMMHHCRCDTRKQ
jgi:hypothetical protein